LIGGEHTFSDLVNGNTTPVECSHIVTGLFRGVSTAGTYKETKSLDEMRKNIDLNIHLKISAGFFSLESDFTSHYDKYE
jgi:hypothetical protein